MVEGLETVKVEGTGLVLATAMGLVKVSLKVGAWVWEMEVAWETMRAVGEEIVSAEALVLELL
jgi:hypothetical protein